MYICALYNIKYVTKQYFLRFFFFFAEKYEFA